MKKKMLSYSLLTILFVGFLAILGGTAEALPADCGLNVSTFNITPVSVGMTGVVQVNWTIVLGVQNSSFINVTNVTIFDNTTREILCQNLSLRINATNTYGNCSLSSSAFVDRDALVLVGEAESVNASGVVSRCTNVTRLAGLNINNTAPTFNGTAQNGKVFTGLRGAATDNLSISVDNATRNCTLTIGNAQGQSQQLSTVITKGPTGTPQNCTYQPTFSSNLPDGSYWIRWSLFDGLDTRFTDAYYTFQLKEGGTSGGDTPIVDVAAQVGQTTAEQNKRNLITVFLLIASIGALVWYLGNK